MKNIPKHHAAFAKSLAGAATIDLSCWQVGREFCMPPPWTIHAYLPGPLASCAAETALLTACALRPACSLQCQCWLHTATVAAVPLLCQASKFLLAACGAACCTTSKAPICVRHSVRLPPTVPCHLHLVTGCRLHSALALACSQMLALTDSASPHS